MSASPSLPGSPLIRCLQYRQAKHDEKVAAAEEANIVFTVDETEADSSRREALAREAPPNMETSLLVQDSDGQLHIRKNHSNRQGQAQHCCLNWLQRPPFSRWCGTPSLFRLHQVRSSVGAPPQISSTTFATVSKVKLKRAPTARRRRVHMLAKLRLDDVH